MPVAPSVPTPVEAEAPDGRRWSARIGRGGAEIRLAPPGRAVGRRQRQERDGRAQRGTRSGQEGRAPGAVQDVARDGLAALGLAGAGDRQGAPLRGTDPAVPRRRRRAEVRWHRSAHGAPQVVAAPRRARYPEPASGPAAAVFGATLPCRPRALHAVAEKKPDIRLYAAASNAALTVEVKVLESRASGELGEILR